MQTESHLQHGHDRSNRARSPRSNHRSPRESVPCLPSFCGLVMRRSSRRRRKSICRQLQSFPERMNDRWSRLGGATFSQLGATSWEILLDTLPRHPGNERQRFYLTAPDRYRRRPVLSGTLAYCSEPRRHSNSRSRTMLIECLHFRHPNCIYEK